MRKKVKKSLSLNKMTVVNLEQKYLRNTKGGTVYTDPGSTCKFCPTEDTFCVPTGTMCPTPETNDCSQMYTCVNYGFTCTCTI